MSDLKIKRSNIDPMGLESRAPVEDQMYGKEITEIHDRQDAKFAEDTMVSSGAGPFALFSMSYQSRPEIEPPLEVHKEALEKAHAELKQLPKSIEDDEESFSAQNDLNRKEHQLLKLMIEAIKLQKSQNETSGRIHQETILRSQQINKELQNNMLSYLDEIIARNKTTNKVQWANTAFTAALIAGGLASLGIIASGGTALPAILTACNSIASVGSGGLTITKAYLDYENQKQTSEVVELKETREFNHLKMNQSMKEMQDSIDHVSQNWEMLREILRALHEASTNMK